MLQGFQPKDVERIRNLLSAFEQGRLSQNMPRHSKQSPAAVETYIGKTQAEIAGIETNDDDETEVSSATVNLHRYEQQDDADKVLTDLSVEVEAYNLSASAIPADSFVTIIREPYSGKYFATSGSQSTLKVVRLTSPLSPCGSASATALTFDDEADPQDPYCTCPQWVDGSETLTVWDALDRGFAQGDKVAVAFIPMTLEPEGYGEPKQVGRWVIVEAVAEIVRFKLLTNLQRNGFASAALMQWNGQAYVETGCNITVRDTLLSVFGPAPGELQEGIGAAGFAWKFKDRNSYEIIFMERFALFVNAVTTSGFQSGNYGCQATATVSYSWRGIPPTSNPITVILPPAYSNICSCFPTGTPVTAAYDEKLDAYRVIEISTALQVCDVETCVDGQTNSNPACESPQPVRVGTIKFGDGLKAEFPTPCTAVVTADGGVEVCAVASPETQEDDEILACVVEPVKRIIFDGCGVGIAAELEDECKPTARITFNPLTVCDDDEQDQTCTPTNKIIFTGDVTVTPAGLEEDCDTVTVDVDSDHCITVCDDDPYACHCVEKINFVDCLDVKNYDEENSSVDVGLEGGTGQEENVTVVTSIQCDGEGRIEGYCTKVLTFNACGLLTAVGSDDCSHDCYYYEQQASLFGAFFPE